MGVLPDRSKKTVPKAYWELMTSEDSPIIDFYPRDFELDMNGKKMEWEAVVKIPFIDQDRLLDALKTKEHLLTPDEKARNGFGASLKFTYWPDVQYLYPSSLPMKLHHVDQNLMLCIAHQPPLARVNPRQYERRLRGVPPGSPHTAIPPAPLQLVLKHATVMYNHCKGVLLQEGITLIYKEERERRTKNFR